MSSPDASWRDQLQLLRQAPFARLWGAQTVSGFGDGVFRVAQITLLLDLNGSAAAVSGLLLANVLPGIAFGLLGGLLADRLDRRALLVTANALRGLMMLALTAVIALGAVQVWHLYLLALVYGVVSAFANPAFDALLPAVVPRAQLVRANALFLLGDNVAAIAGPALGGLLVVAFGAALAVGVNALTFGLLVLALLTLPKSAPRAAGAASLLTDAREGWVFARSQPLLPRLLGLFGVINVGAAVLAVSLPLYVTQSLHLAPAAYGGFLAAMNAGMVVMLAVLASTTVRRRGLLVAWSFVLMGFAGYMALGVTREVWVAVLAVAVIDALVMIPNVLFPAWVQSSVPDELRGRVFGLVTVASYALVPLGFALAGMLVATLEPAGSLLAAGVLIGVVGLMAVLSRTVRSWT